MIDTKELLQKIMAAKTISEEQARRIVSIIDERLKTKKTVPEEKVYTDEPIRSEQFHGPRQRQQQNDTSIDRIAAMRRIAFEPGSRGKTPDEIFFLQAKFMEDFEDHYVPAAAAHSDFRRQEFGLYFRGFNAMSTSAIRAYYTWRTNFRRGELTRTELRNAFIYAMELIHCIGFDTAEEAYAALHSFIEDYSALDHRIRSFGRKWLKDFVIFYGLDSSLLEGRPQVPDSIKSLVSPTVTDDATLFAAMTKNANYDFERSRFYKLNPEAVVRVCCKVYRAAMEESPQNCRNRFVGTYNEMNYDLFGAALFCSRSSRNDYVYEESPFCRYIARDGKWYVDILARTGKQSAALGGLLKNTECILRKRMKFSSQLKPVELTAETAALINKMIDEYLAEQREADLAKISFDLTKLDTIRNSAEETAELLLAESDDRREEAPQIPLPPETDEKPEINPEKLVTEPQTAFPETDDAYGIPEFSEAEKTLIKCLAFGSDYRDAMQKLSVLPSIAADSINEKLMETFLDTVIADNGSKLEIIEDYLEDLKGIAEKL